MPAAVKISNGGGARLRTWSLAAGRRMRYAESFHSRLRDEFFALEEFESLATAKKLMAAWKDDYNHRRPTVRWATSPRRVCRPLGSFRSGVGFGHASANSSASGVT